MTSRMEKYYKSRDTNRRSVRNQQLYQTIYEDETYSNIEGVVNTPNSNEIDIDKIRELISSHEKEKDSDRRLIKEIRQPELNNEIEEEKNYDIRDILVKAKDSRKEDNNDYHSLKNTEYNILKNIKINNKQKEEQENELKELINTITSKSLVNRMSDSDLSLNLLDDLKSNTVINGLDNKNTNNNEMDNTFFTTGVNFKKEDFEQIEDLSKSIHKNNKIMKYILITLFVVIALVIIYFIYRFAIVK